MKKADGHTIAIILMSTVAVLISFVLLYYREYLPDTGGLLHKYDGSPSRKEIHSITELDKLYDDLDDIETGGGSGAAETDSAYQLRSIVIYTDDLKETYGAGEIISYPEAEEYILRFDSVDQTKKAFDTIRKQYGDKCYLDEVIELQGIEDDAADVGGSDDHLSWGCSFMGFDKVIGKPFFENAAPLTVAVIDTGVDADHALFSKRVFAEGYDFVGMKDSPGDSSGHGTHTAGIISECTPPNVRIMPLRVFNARGKTTWLYLNNAIRYAVEKKADVINMSIGISTKSDTEHHELDESLSAAAEAGIPVCCASGNDGLEVSHTYPACSSLTLAVSSIGKTGLFSATYDGDGGSGYGTGIDFCAPGEDILGASLNGSTKEMSGTSQAAAHLSAAFAVLRTVYPQASYPELIGYAKQNSVDYGEEGKDQYYGWGLIEFSRIADSLPEPEDSDDNKSGSSDENTDDSSDENTDDSSAENSSAEKEEEKAAADTEAARASFAPLMLKSGRQTGTSITLSWRKVKGAKQYVIYGNVCGKKNKKVRLRAVSGNTGTVRKISNAKLKKATYYKFKVVALDGSNKVIAESRLIHAATKGAGNHTGLTTAAKGGKVSLKQGRSFRLKARAAGRRVRKHVGVRYESSDPDVATVSSSGRITAKKKGKCRIYVYAQNGISKTIRVTIRQ